MQRIYFDHAATTPVDGEVAQLMLSYMTEKFGNPSSLHYFGRQIGGEVEKARMQVADLIGASKNEIYFTGGGTEADNWALKGIASRNRKKGNHIITTQIEHHAILHTCEYLEKQGFEITYLPVDQYGMVSLADVEHAIREQTILVSIMFANNEVGTVQPIKEIGQLTRDRGIYFHTDAVAAVGHIPIDVVACNIDLLTMTGHKFHGPKGIGALYIRNGVRIDALLHGGAQEKNSRAGTENVASIIGLGKAAQMAQQDMEKDSKHVQGLRERLITGIRKQIVDCKFNGHSELRLPGNVNFCFSYVEGESLLLNLDMKGIAVSTGSACASGSLDPSHVLLAMGISHEIAQGSLRITLGRDNTAEDITYFLEVLPQIIDRLRNMSPLNSFSTASQSDPCSRCHHS